MTPGTRFHELNAHLEVDPMNQNCKLPDTMKDPPPSKRVSPKWSLTTSFWFCLGVTAIITPIIILTEHQSIWVELEMVTGILAGLMFPYFSVILHQGVRFNDSRRAIIDWPSSSPTVIRNGMDLWLGVGFFSEFGAGLGFVGLILGFILDMVLMLVLALIICWLFWLGSNGVLAVIVFLYWVHRRWLRYLVTRGRRCRGNWPRSLIHGGKVALLYSLCFYLVIFVARQIAESV